MHFEILVEEKSAEKALDNLLPRLVLDEHTYRIISHQGKYDLLNKLSSKLKAYSKFINDDWLIIVLIDLDNRSCSELKTKLNQIATSANLKVKGQRNSNNYQIINRIAIEELEAWFLGDPDAVLEAFPRVKNFKNKPKYRIPDSIMKPSETLERILQNAGYFSTGIRKVEVASLVSTYMNPLQNRSKSFQVFWNSIYERIVDNS